MLCIALFWCKAKHGNQGIELCLVLSASVVLKISYTAMGMYRTLFNIYSQEGNEITDRES